MQNYILLLACVCGIHAMPQRRQDKRPKGAEGEEYILVSCQKLPPRM